MAVIETWYNQDLSQPVNVHYLKGNVFSQDNGGNTIGVNVFENGEPASLSGTVSASVIRADGATVAVSGTLSGNQCSVVLPQAAYYVPGVLSIVIKLTSGTTVTTLCAVVANVYQTSTDTTVDPGTIIPSVTALIAQIDAAVGSIPADYSALLAAVAADYSPSKAYPTVGAYAWYNGVLKRSIVPIPTAETYNSAHWTDAVIGDDISALKSALNNSLNVSSFGWEIGSLNSGSGTDQASNTRIRSDYVPVTKGTKITVTGNPNCLVVYCFDQNKAWLSDTSWSSINNSFTVPDGVAFVRILIRVSISNQTIATADVEAQYNRCSVYVILPQRVYTLPTELDAVSDSINGLADITMETVTKTSLIDTVWNAGGYKDANGNVQTNSSYSYSDLIPVSPGNIVRSSHMRFVTAYKTETTTSYSDFKTDVTGYTVSAVTHYIVISKANAYTSEPIYIEHTEKQNSAFPKLTVLETVCNGTPGMKKTGNLSNGSIGFNAFAAIRKGKTYSFYGKITAFNKLTIGCGTNTVNSSNIEIDTTNVKFNNASATINTTAHGLTFLNYIYVIVNIDGNAFPTVTIYTDGGNFTKTYADEWIGSAVAVHADADSSTMLTDCVLTFSAADVKKDIWYCGDSYMAVRDGGKLPSKLKYFNVFQNLNSIGFSGAGSENVLPDVLIMFGMDLIPKYLVWAIGMNNGDTSSAVNATWKAGYDQLIELANGGNFELILATIPNTPTINNNFKNDIVRNSGFRFIDFADAVQTSQGASTWISGMLSSDNVHPTSEGAKALASRLCADFPEIFN